MKKINHLFPYFTAGPIIKGFGRGSKELGFPTANYPVDVVNALPKDIQNGIYFGWANVDNGQVYKMVMSIGWNPFYHNVERSAETHILHRYDNDLYGQLLKICICGYLRPEKTFDGVSDLIAAIEDDVKQTENELEKSEYKQYSNHEYFLEKIINRTTTADSSSAINSKI